MWISSDPGCGIHDEGYNGPNVDGTTLITLQIHQYVMKTAQQRQLQLQDIMVVQLVLLMTVQVMATAVQNLGSVMVLKIVKTKHLVVI